MAETQSLVPSQAPAAAKPLDDLVDCDRDGVTDLVPGGRYARRGTAAGAAPKLIDLVLESVQAALEGGDVAVERRFAMVEHGTYPFSL
jgi:hypothetical protein